MESKIGPETRFTPPLSRAPHELTMSGPILWGIDPNLGDDCTRMRDFLLLWSAGVGHDIHPVTIRPSLASAEAPRVSDAIEAVQARLAASPSSHMKPLVIIGSDDTNTEEAFLDLAEDENASLLAVTTHAPLELRMLRLGSFAESLIANSKIPVLVMNPETIAPERIETILFATDLSSELRPIFERVLGWASAFHARVVLYHHYDPLYATGLYGEFGVYADGSALNQLIEDARQLAQTELSQWRALAEARGLICDIELSEMPESIEDGLHRAAIESRADVIAMATERGPMGQRFLGSLARDTIVSAKRPVIVSHL